MIGLAGSHRTGKTTLARMFSEEYKIPLAETSSTEVFRELGADPRADYDMKTRLVIQDKILESACNVYEALGHQFITDRTPIDMLAYTLADVQRANISEFETALLEKYMDRCFTATNKYFSILCVVQPGIPIVEDPGKAPANIMYMEHINGLVKGLVMHDDIAAYRLNMRRRMTDLDERLDALTATVHSFFDKHVPAPGSCVFH